MSAPHTARNPLVACPHAAEGWCLFCVQDLVRDHEQAIEDAYEAAERAAEEGLDDLVSDCIVDVENAIRDAIARQQKIKRPK